MIGGGGGGCDDGLGGYHEFKQITANARNMKNATMQIQRMLDHLHVIAHGPSSSTPYYTQRTIVRRKGGV